MSRVGTLHGDDGSFDREFWARIPPLHELTAADLERAGTIFQIGVPPNRIDIVTTVDGVGFAEAWPGRAETAYGDQTVHVIGRRHLVQNKRASGRPQDLLDLEILENG
jgi:hypothetical protein